METTQENPRKALMKDISETLRNFDFENFDPRTDKSLLMETLQSINVKLGSLLKGYK